MLNWIVWNRTVFNIEIVYLCKTELFEWELFICIKIDVALITCSGWYAIKPNQKGNELEQEWGTISHLKDTLKHIVYSTW